MDSPAILFHGPLFHRMVSDDSGIFGTVPIASVIGGAWLRSWPIGTLGVFAAPTPPNLSPSGPSPSS